MFCEFGIVVVSARIAAILSTVAIDHESSFAGKLSQELRSEFRSLLRRQAKTYLRDVRALNGRYLAEMTKFGSRYGAPPAIV